MRKIIIFLIVIFLSGCSVQAQDNVTELAIEHMENTYGEPFYYLETLSKDEIKLLLNSFTLSKYVYVEGTLNENGEYEFIDNYIAVKNEDNLRNLFDIAVGYFFEEYLTKVYVYSSPVSSDLNINSTFEEYFSHPDSKYAGVIVIPDGEFIDRTFKIFIDTIESMGLHPVITLVVMEKEDFEKYTTANIDETIENCLYSKTIFVENTMPLEN